MTITVCPRCNQQFAYSTGNNAETNLYRPVAYDPDTKEPVSWEVICQDCDEKEEQVIKTKIANCFKSGLGQQCEELYSTSDNRVFIRFEEADKHTLGALNPNTQPLMDQTIREWFREDMED
jgi:uncharacterized protein YbaR (Trm112 family)